MAPKGWQTSADRGPGLDQVQEVPLCGEQLIMQETTTSSPRKVSTGGVSSFWGPLQFVNLILVFAVLLTLGVSAASAAPPPQEVMPA